jgi:hypothetical protein
MTVPQSPYENNVKELKDYYWSYADILRDDTEDLSLDALFGEFDELMRVMCSNYKNNGLLGMK